MDEVGQIIVALYEGLEIDIGAIENDIKFKLLRLKAVACYAGFRLMQIMEMIKDVEFILTGLLGQDDDFGLVYDAALTSLQEHLVRFESYMFAVCVFCMFKNIPPRPFLGLCPGLPDRINEFYNWVDDIAPDKFITLEEERLLDREYLAFSF